jgi:electron transfer flavoprotein beta subunit
MKSCVLMAYVPDTASVIKISGSSNRIDEADIKWIVSPYDEYALEAAIQLKEARTGAVTVITFGPERAQQGVRECLARGADAAVHVSGGEATFGDALAIAKVLAAAIRKVGPFDVIFTGVKGVGSDNSLVGAMVAELLDLPHVASVVKLEIGETSLEAHREIEGGTEVVTAPLPCVDLGFDEAALSGPEATCRWRALTLPAAKAGGTILKGEEDPAVAARDLARLLREQAKAI